MDGIMRRHRAHERELEQRKPDNKRSQAGGVGRVKIQPGENKNREEKGSRPYLACVLDMSEHISLGLLSGKSTIGAKPQWTRTSIEHLGLL